MSVYAWMVLLILLFAFVMQGNLPKNKKYIIVACILLFVVMGFRDVFVIGNDSAGSYRHMFKHIPETEWSDIKLLKDNAGMTVLVKAMYAVTSGDFQTFMIIISAFFIVCFAWFVNKYSVSPVQSIIYYLGLLLYIFMFDALKQSIAMSILLFSFDAAMDKKLTKFLILTVLAAWFHFPALVFIPAYWIVNMKTGTGYIVVLAIMLALTYLFRDEILNIMLKAYGTEIIDTKMRFFGNKAIIMLIIVAAALILRPPTQGDKLYCALLQLIGVSVVLQTFASYNNTFERLADYYFQYAVVFIPLAFEKCELKKTYFSDAFNRMVKTFASFVFCGFGIWRFLDYVNNCWYLSPYVFYFGKK